MATRKIAGITIELNADTKAFVKGIRTLDKQLKTTENNLKDINSLLKFNPKNVTLLTQKQKELKSAITDTEEKLKQLKSAQTDALSSDEYDKLQREIIETQNKLSTLKKSYKDFGSVSKQVILAAGDQVKAFGKKLTDVGASLTTAVTAPLAGLAAAALAAFNEVDAGTDAIIMRTGATGDSLRAFKKSLEDIVTSIPTDFQTAGDAIGEVNTLFGYTDETLTRVSEKFIKFAKVNNEDVVSSVDAVNEAMRAWVNKDPGEESVDMYLDRLTDVSQKTGTSVGKLLEGVTKNKVALEQLGLKLAPATELIGQLYANGVDAERVMSALATAQKNAAKNGKSLGDAVKDLQKKIQNNASDTDVLNAAYELFGKNGAYIVDLIKSGKLDLSALNGELDLVYGTVENTYDAIMDPTDGFQVALNEVKILASDIAESAMPALKSIMEQVRDVVKNLRDKWNSLTDEQKEMILKCVGIVIAIGPVITALGGIATGVGNIITLIGNLVGALAGFMPPAGFIIAGVVAAAALVIANWDDIVVFWDETLKPAIDAIGQAFVDFYEQRLVPIADWLVDTFGPAFKSVEDFMSDLLTWLTDVFSGNWEDAWSALVANFGSVFGKLGELAKGPINAIIDGINWMIDKVESAVNTIVDGINSNLYIRIKPFSLGWPINKSFGGFNWSANLSRVSFGRVAPLGEELGGAGRYSKIAGMYLGGVLAEGRRAVVGEYAPEYLRVVNGRAVVTPINSPRGEDTRMGGTNNYTFNVYAQPGQSAEQIAQEVQRIMVRQHRQRSVAYAQYT